MMRAKRVLVTVGSLVLRPVSTFLLRPSVRYRYLPKVHELLHYSRKEEMLRTCFQYIESAQVRGDYLEFGVWKGGSLIAAYHLSQHFEGLSQIRFYAFDSFEGIPPLTVNRAEGEQFPPGSLRSSLEEVKRNLEEAKVDVSRVSLIKGWYGDILTEATRRSLPIKTAAVVNVDCDVFESTVAVLDFIEPYLVEGSVIIFDDWYCFKNNRALGEQKAFREWLERNPRLRATAYKDFGWDGRSFIINMMPEESRGLA